MQVKKFSSDHDSVTISELAKHDRDTFKKLIRNSYDCIKESRLQAEYMSNEVTPDNLFITQELRKKYTNMTELSMEKHGTIFLYEGLVEINVSKLHLPISIQTPCLKYDLYIPYEDNEIFITSTSQEEISEMPTNFIIPGVLANIHKHTRPLSNRFLEKKLYAMPDKEIKNIDRFLSSSDQHYHAKLSKIIPNKHQRGVLNMTILCRNSSNELLRIDMVDSVVDVIQTQKQTYDDLSLRDSRNLNIMLTLYGATSQLLDMHTLYNKTVIHLQNFTEGTSIATAKVQIGILR
jgi:hypothetical protein